MDHQIGTSANGFDTGPVPDYINCKRQARLDCHGIRQGREGVMSVTVSYKPVVNGNVLRNGSSTVEKLLRETFGDFPIELNLEHISSLVDLVDMVNTNPNPFEELIDAIYTHNGIMVYAEW